MQGVEDVDHGELTNDEERSKRNAQ
jgi:hypothetical protein